MPRVAHSVADELQPDALERFLRYVRIDTQSDLDSDTFPSTAKQLDLSRLLADELRAAGLTDVQRKENEISERLVSQFLAADVIVIGAPMYNFSMPVQLKGWFDAVARAGVTFRYTENGPEGLLKNKKVFVATSRGGIYPADADPQVPHIRMLLNFLGLTDHAFIHSPAQSMGPEAAAQGQAEADAAVAALA